MRTLTTEQLKTIFDNHKLWLADSSQGERADLSDADLRFANLRSADLQYSDLRSADLSNSNLICADLRCADLRYANLRNSNLRGADLSYANLRHADLRFADLSNSNLSFADLQYSDLRCANLSACNLSNTSILTFQFNKHQAIYTPDGSLTIGCHCLPITEWVETYEDIGFHERYSDEEIEEYGAFIVRCLGRFKKQNP